MYKKIRISLIGLALLFISINLLNQSAGAQGTSLTLAIIGDYGMNNSAEASVAALVKSWNPELILTTGDDYYASAGGTGADKYDLSTGAYFCEYLRDITTTGTLCPAGQSSLNRFFPTLGNHDYYDAGLSGTLPATYLNYFTLPGEGYTNSSGNERYYDFSYGPIHFFMLNSLQDEYLSDPDGATSTSAQAAWLRTQLAASTATWNIVLFHHPPYSSGYHGSSTWMQWPFAEWGADAVLSGHDHLYERLLVDGIVYMINGAGGSGLYPFNTPLAESVFRYNSNYGAQKITASDTTLTFEFFSIENGGQLIDSVTLAAPGVTLTPIPPTLTPTAPPNSGSLDLRIAASADDIEQRLSDGAMYLTSSDLELVNDPYYFGDQNVGLRFNNVAIPQGATITNAFIEFEAKETAGETTALVIALQAADNAPAFTSAPYNLTSRPLTTASVAWNLPAWTVIGSKQTTPSLATPLQEVINRPGWVPGNSLVVLFSGSGRRTAWAWEGKSASAALLHIEYTSGAIPTASSTPTVTGTATITTTPTATGTATITATPVKTRTPTRTITPTLPLNSGSLDLRIAASADDIEQRLSDGAMYLTSSDLELVNDPYYFGDQNVGLRFNNVAIPQGATITNAFIEFEAKETAGETTALVIALQAADNAPAFTSAPYNLTSRPLTTASVAWNLPAWTVIGSKQTTPSLATPLQEVINRPGWVPGNSLVVLFSGSGRRTAWAWEGKSASAALLHIEYTSSAIPTASSTPTVTGTATITATATGTSTITTTPTATITATPSSTPTATITATPSSTPTATETATIIATVTATETATIIATATATPTATGTATITATATPAGMHISDLDASSSRQLTRWTARVTVTVRSAGNQVLSGVTVTATWSAGANGTVSCTTNNSGICTLSKSNLSLTTASVTFKVTRLTKTGWIYQPTANQDPEGDSNGTDIIVTRP